MSKHPCNTELVVSPNICTPPDTPPVGQVSSPMTLMLVLLGVCIMQKFRR